MIKYRLFTTVAGATKRPVWKVKQNYYHRLWRALTDHKWHEFERLLKEMWMRNINLDEVTYTLKAHYCILNPHTPSMNCYMVLEEMKKALVHPAVIRMNENLLNSYFELEELKCQPPFALWQNYTKLIWQTSMRLNRKRMNKLKALLQQMDPDDLNKLSDQDVAALAQEEFLQAMFSSTLTMDEIHDEPIEVKDAAQKSQYEGDTTVISELRREDSDLLAEKSAERDTEDDTMDSEENLDIDEKQEIERDYVYEKQDGHRESTTTFFS
ncbi:hypothetical protein BgAZ_206880 [Babesia gibsoni]|uniref:Uncharacterized protein n=1 Tax=Babesia gibsoni TaxID=33632 RepID=A0AAD8PEE0_BABGI|nr:hypothetical protein BgAZ_206880 [Babesia gibsoni]